MADSIDEISPQNDETGIIKITEEMHQRDINRQKKREKLGIKRTTLMEANLSIGREYFVGVINKFMEESRTKPFPELVEDLEILPTRVGINSKWEFCKSSLGSFGRIGEVYVDWVSEQRCSIRIDVFPPCPQPDLDMELLLFKSSIKVLNRFGNLLDEELLAESKINVNHVTLPVINKKGKPGRPHWEEDIWAHKQVNDLGQPYAVVFKEWQQRINRKLRDPVDPKRQFSRIIKQDWLSDKNDNNE